MQKMKQSHGKLFLFRPNPLNLGHWGTTIYENYASCGHAKNINETNHIYLVVLFFKKQFSHKFNVPYRTDCCFDMHTQTNQVQSHKIPKEEFNMFRCVKTQQSYFYSFQIIISKLQVQNVLGLLLHYRFNTKTQNNIYVLRSKKQNLISLQILIKLNVFCTRNYSYLKKFDFLKLSLRNE